MKNTKINRWVYAMVGVIVLLFAGLVYAWSVLASPIGAYFSEWTKAQLSLTFTICMICFCLGCLVGGLLTGKINVKINVWASAVLFLIGFFLASKANTLGMLYLGYGVFAGFASGLAYNAVMSTILKWFPDKQGFISGILLMGFALGSFVIGKIYQAVTPSGAGMENWRDSFFIFGIILFVVLGVCGCFFAKPTAADVASYRTDLGGKKLKHQEVGLDISAKEMLQRSSFWLFFVWVVLMSTAGLALIAQAGGVAAEVGVGVGAGTIATVVGLISIFNGIGRMFFGGMFDKLGRKITMITINIAFMCSVAILLIAMMQQSFTLIIIGFICTGFSYGGVNPMNSAFISTFYGAANYPVNFSVINLNLIISSFGGTAAGMLYDASGSYLSTFLLMIGLAAVALIAQLLIKKP